MTLDPRHEPTADAGTDTTVTPVPVTTAPVTPMTPAPEPAAVPDAAAFTGTTSTARPGGGRVRWFAAIGVIALVVAASAAVGLVLTGASATAVVTGYVPADSQMYGEVRLDLPGDQKREIGEFLSKFPGFADQAALDTKLDEVLDRLVTEASDGKQTFTADIEPWFDGELAFAMGGVLDAPDPAAERPEFHGLVLLSIKDAALAQAWFTDIFTTSGVTSTTETYQDTQLTVFSDASMFDQKAAFAIVDGRVAIAGDLASVQAAIDTDGNAGLAADDDFRASLAAHDGDHVGFVFVDLQALMASSLAMTESLASAPPVSQALLAQIPDWASFRLRIEGDAVLMDGATPAVDGAPGPDTNRANGVAAWAPPSTIALAAANDYGATLQETVALYRAEPALSDALEGVDQAAGLLGGLDAAIGWIGDAGVVIAPSGDSVEGGIIAIPTEGADAAPVLTSLRNLVALGGQGVAITDEPYAGTTITTIDLGAIGDLVGMAGALGGAEVPPEAAAGLPDEDVRIAYAVTDGVVVIGSGADFVKHVLDAGAGESLADTSRYRDLVGRVGAEHTAVSYLDIAAVRGLIEGMLPMASAEDRAEYEESIKPFLTPFDAFVGASTTGSDLTEQHAVITVK